MWIYYFVITLLAGWISWCWIELKEGGYGNDGDFGVYLVFGIMIGIGITFILLAILTGIFSLFGL